MTRIVIFCMAILLLAACGASDPAPTPTPDAPSATPGPGATATLPIIPITPLATQPIASATPFVRPTLPPSWTPTASPTNLPTRTPSLTPTITPTRTNDEICNEGFTVSLMLLAGVSYSLDESATFIVTTNEVSGIIVWQAVNQRTGDDLTLTFPGGLPYLGNLDLSLLPGPGDYIWTASLSLPDQPDLCVTSGEFTVVNETLLEQIRESQLETATPTNSADN